MSRLVPVLALLLACALAPAAAAQGPTREVLYVGNNWEGTTDVVDPHTLQRLDRVNVIPDYEERVAELKMDPVAYGFFLGIRELVGEGHDQFNDDVFSSHDGRTIYVSRPSFKDVVAIDLKSKEIVWRFVVEGNRADHMAISPDGTRLLARSSSRPPGR